jgi:hypothetical protein
MVYLSVAVVVLVIALWKVSSRTDPHHIFFVSLLPLLDLDHSAGTSSDFEQNCTVDDEAA